MEADLYANEHVISRTLPACIAFSMKFEQPFNHILKDTGSFY